MIAILQLVELTGPNHMFDFLLAAWLTYFIAKALHKHTGMLPTLFGTEAEVAANKQNDEKMWAYSRTCTKNDGV